MSLDNAGALGYCGPGFLEPVSYNSLRCLRLVSYLLLPSAVPRFSPRSIARNGAPTASSKKAQRDHPFPARYNPPTIGNAANPGLSHGPGAERHAAGGFANRVEYESHPNGHRSQLECGPLRRFAVLFVGMPGAHAGGRGVAAFRRDSARGGHCRDLPNWPQHRDCAVAGQGKGQWRGHHRSYQLRRQSARRSVCDSYRCADQA